MSRKISTFWHFCRWKIACLIEKTGRAPLLACLIPIFLAGYWVVILQPQEIELKQSLSDVQHKLLVPAPLIPNELHIQDDKLSITEYQQVKMLFDIFHQYHLKIDSGSYQLKSTENNSPGAMTLTIPLNGTWMSLARALRDINRALPLEVERLHISRSQPDTDLLSIKLQLILRRGQS
ncbi:hypothetical protein [Serratia ficaria]|uniref:hypothetical protein n=1 Tax=Serratia ficaria TaxID=61651 RepID=UPI00217B13A5|nr:hypothetical protein [Serratia ficaria]CAI1510242.1 Uncharacterised protein [Serratia ficaria]